MEVANGPLYDTQQITNNERSKTPSADVRMSLARGVSTLECGARRP